MGARNQFGATALMAAIQSGNIDCVRLLLDRGIDVNARNRSGSTALTWACGTGNTDAVRLFLRHGADVHLRDDTDQTAGDGAGQRQSGDPDALKAGRRERVAAD